MSQKGGMVHFSGLFTDVVASRADGVYRVEVERVGGGHGAVSCQVYTEEHTAQDGLDFTHVTATLKWQDGAIPFALVQVWV